MDMRKAGIMAKHLNVDGTNEQLLHLLLRQVTLQEFQLEPLALQGNDLVFFLL